MSNEGGAIYSSETEKGRSSPQTPEGGPSASRGPSRHSLFGRFLMQQVIRRSEAGERTVVGKHGCGETLWFAGLSCARVPRDLLPHRFNSISELTGQRVRRQEHIKG